MLGGARCWVRQAPGEKRKKLVEHWKGEVDRSSGGGRACNPDTF